MNKKVNYYWLFWFAVFVGLFSFRGGLRGLLAALWLLIAAFLFIQASIFVYTFLYYLRNRNALEVEKAGFWLRGIAILVLPFWFYLLTYVLPNLTN